MTNGNTIGERLSALRTERGLTQEQVAEIVGVNYVSLSRYETGKRMPKMDILAKLAEHYGVTVDEIINGETKKEPAQPDESAQMIFDKISSLSPENRSRAEAYIAALLDTQAP